MLTRRRAILAKIETTYGVDSVPTGAANAILVSDFEVLPMELKAASRDLLRPYFGNSENLPGTAFMKASFSVEIAGAGAAGTAPAYGPLLRACAFAETIVAGNRVEYAPVSSSLEAVTLYGYVDGVLHKGTGCRGTVSLDMTVESVPKFKFDFTGVFNPITDATLPTTVYTNWQKPLIVNRVNTPTFSLHGYAAVLEKLSIDVANAVDFQSLINEAESVQLTDRKPVGSISMKAVTVATKDWWTSIKNATTGAMQLIHGVTAGNIVQFDAPAAQLTAPKYGDKNGVVMLNGSLVFAPSSGNDELKITVK